jgi:hypothetical protein
VDSRGAGEDTQEPNKHRNTAKRVCGRLKDERSHTGAYTIVKGVDQKSKAGTKE